MGRLDYDYELDCPYHENELLRQEVGREVVKIIKAIYETGDLQSLEKALCELCRTAEIDMNKTGIYNSTLFKVKEAI